MEPWTLFFIISREYVVLVSSIVPVALPNDYVPRVASRQLPVAIDAILGIIQVTSGGLNFNRKP